MANELHELTALALHEVLPLVKSGVQRFTQSCCCLRRLAQVLTQQIASVVEPGDAVRHGTKLGRQGRQLQRKRFSQPLVTPLGRLALENGV